MTRKGEAPAVSPAGVADASGNVYALLAYTSWGVVPLFWKLFGALDPIQILAHRVVFSLLFVVALLLVARRRTELVATLRSFARMRVLFATSLLIALNWGIFIYAVMAGRLVEASLGYFINPLLNVALGVLVLRESIRPLAKLGVLLGAVGLGVMVLGRSAGGLWIALTLAGSFAVYGFLRKRAPVESLVGLFVESLFVAPLALGYLIWCEAGRRGVLTTDGPLLLCVLSGPITALPLAWFASAARRLPLSRLGFFQYIAPSLQFVLAVTLLGERLDPQKLAAFAVIWAALALVAVDAVRARKA